MKETMRSRNSIDIKPMDYMHTASYLLKRNGELKRRRHKDAYKDIQLERSNYIKDILRISNNTMKVWGGSLRNSNNDNNRDGSDRQLNQLQGTHYTTFNRKRVFDPYKEGIDGMKCKTFDKKRNSNDDIDTGPINSKRSCFKSKGSSNSNTQRDRDRGAYTERERDRKQKSIEFSKDNLYNLMRKSTPSNASSSPQRQLKCHKSQSLFNNTHNLDRGSNTNDNELNQLKVIKSEIEAMIRLKEETNANDHNNQFIKGTKEEKTNNNKLISGEIVTSNKSLGLLCNSSTDMSQMLNNKNSKVNERYSQKDINCKDSIEDIHKQIENEHKQLTNIPKLPFLKGKKTKLHANDNDKDNLNSQREERNDDNNNIADDSNEEHKTEDEAFAIKDNDNDMKEEQLKGKNKNLGNINQSIVKGNNSSKAIEDSQNNYNNHHSNDNIDYSNKVTKDVNQSTNEDFHNTNDINTQAKAKNDEEFIDSKGNHYNLNDIYQIILTHQMTINSIRDPPSTNNPLSQFSDTDYAKLIEFLNKAHYKHSDNNHRSNSQSSSPKKIRYKILSTIEQSTESNKLFNSKLFSTLNQLKGELIAQQKASITNRHLLESQFPPSTQSQLIRSKNMLLTSQSKSKSKSNSELKPIKGILKNNEENNENNHIKVKPLALNTLTLLSNSNDKKTLSPEKSNYYLTKLKQDINNYSNSKYKSDYYMHHSLTSRTLSESQRVNTQYTITPKKTFQSKTHYYGIMPANDIINSNPFYN